MRSGGASGVRGPDASTQGLQGRCLRQAWSTGGPQRRRRDAIPHRRSQFNQASRYGGTTAGTYAGLEQKVEERTREVEEKSRQLEMASQHKSQFLASMSHELRTPLNAIIGLTEMMVSNAARFGTEKAAEPLRRVQRVGTHLLGLINQVLDLSKIEAGKLELSSVLVALAPLITEVVDTARPLAEQNNTPSTSEVAVCCSSDLDNSRVRVCTSSNRRTFSIAITAWSAKVVVSSICLSVYSLNKLGKAMSDEELKAGSRPRGSNRRSCSKAA